MGFRVCHFGRQTSKPNLPQNPAEQENETKLKTKVHYPPLPTKQLNTTQGCISAPE